MKRERTAVEWLEMEIEKIPFQSPDVTDYYNDVIALFTQAKAMEKEQIELAFFEGKNDGAFMERYSDYKHITANEYYNETYGDEKNND